MRLGRLAPAGLCLLAVLAAGCVLDAPYEKYAIVYGISDYEGDGNDLLYAADDASAMAGMLSGQGYAVQTRVNSFATRTQLLTDVAAILSSPTPPKEGDLFLFFFSGHGDRIGSGPEAAGGDGQDEWIYLYGSLADLDLTFNDDQLMSAFAAIPCKRKVLILDSCFSGGFIGNGLEADGTPPSLLEGNRSLAASLADAISLYANFDGSSADIPPWEAMVISASGEQEYAYESPAGAGDPAYNHGVLTYFLLQAEYGADRNGDGYVTVTETYDYVRTRINDEWNLRSGYANDAFSPHVSGGPVDYVLFQTR
jgi:uncharacterized caspase-like protein